MLLRMLITLALLLLSAVGSKASRCPPTDIVAQPQSSVLNFEPETTVPGSTSLRGLSLGSTRTKALNALLQLGFPLASARAADRQVNFCRGGVIVGTLRFDVADKLIKMELRPPFFGVANVVLREFADQIFEHYRVQTTKVTDDVCFQDATCFRGTTLSEQFLILRLADDIQLHVSPRTP